MSEQRVYRKKPEGEQEEIKEESTQQPKEATATRGRGAAVRGRGTRGGARPQQDKNTNFSKKGETGDEQHPRERRIPKQDLDENTWYYKYFYAPRPKKEKILVTAETEIPPVLPKDQRQKLPDKASFDQKMKDIDAQVEEMRQNIVSVTAPSDIRIV